MWSIKLVNSLSETNAYQQQIMSNTNLDLTRPDRTGDYWQARLAARSRRGIHDRMHRAKTLPIRDRHCCFFESLWRARGDDPTVTTDRTYRSLRCIVSLQSTRASDPYEVVDLHMQSSSSNSRCSTNGMEFPGESCKGKKDYVRQARSSRALGASKLYTPPHPPPSLLIASPLFLSSSNN